VLEGIRSRPPGQRLALPSLPAGSLRQLATVLLAAVLTETLLLRGAVRVGVHVPKDRAISDLFEAASLLGSLAFNFASILAIVLVTLLVGSLAARQKGALTRAVIVMLGLAMLAGLSLTLTTDRPEADALFGVSAAILVCAVLLSAIGGKEISPPEGAAMALVVAAYLSYEYYALSYLFYRLLDIAAIPPASMSFLRLGEVLAVIASVVAFSAWGLPRRRSIGAAGLAVAAVLLVLTLAALSPVSTVAILALWTTGLGLFLPSPVYAVALGLYLLTIVACWRSGDGFWIATGLLLVLLAGYMAEATYQHVLLLLGVAFLAGRAALVETRPAPVPLGPSGSSRARGR
jgi:hypothetical protein